VAILDLVSQERRSEMMASIHGKNTSPELVVRKALHSLGYRYRLNVKKLPGSPDLVFPRFKAVLFVHGCFWHRHGCKYTYSPKSNTAFWNKKFSQNVERDKACINDLQSRGWRVGIIWECEFRKNGKPMHLKSESLEILAGWLNSSETSIILPAAPTP
jgi:DNA mismatch endonuclease (patch repair protein)